MTTEATRALQDLRRALLEPSTPLRPRTTVHPDNDALTETVGAVA